MTKRCRSCGQGLLDSDRFCDRCGAVQPTRSLQPKAYRRLAESVPKTEVEFLKATLETRIGVLEAKLAESIPKKEADTLYVRLRKLESLLAESVPRREAEAASVKLQGEVEQLKEKLALSLPKVEVQAAKAELLDEITKLEDKLAESVPRGEAERLRVEIEELEKKLAVSKSDADSLHAEVAQLQDRLAQSVPRAESEANLNELEAKVSAERREIEAARETTEDLEGQFSQSSASIDALQGKLSDSVPRTELETARGELESKIVDLRTKLGVSVPGSDADKLRTAAPVTSTPAQTFPQQAGPRKSCPMCKYRNHVDAIFCASCGHMLGSNNGEDKKVLMKLIAHPPIEQPLTVTSMTTGPSIADLGRLSKLKSLLGSRFKHQNNVAPSSSRVQSGDTLEAQLTTLKSQYDSGALKEAEYNEEKRKLLSQV